MKALRTIVAFMTALVRRLSAGSMLDHYLLTRAPLIWRSYLVHVLWFAFLTGLAGVALSYSLFDPAPPTGVPTMLEINAGIQLILFAIGAVWMIWGVTLLRFRLRNGSISRRVATGVFYCIASYALLSAPLGYAHITATRVASVVSNHAEFRENYDTLASFNFGSCHAGTTFPGQGFLDTIIAMEIGSQDSIKALPVLNCIDTHLRCASETPQCVVILKPELAERIGPMIQEMSEDLLRTETYGPMSEFIEPRYSSIQNALNYEEGYESGYDVWTSVWHPIRAGAALTIALVFLAVSTVRTRPRNASTRIAGPNLDWFNFVAWSPAWLRNLDRKMLITSPNEWAMRTHMMVLSSFVITVLFVAGVIGYFYTTGGRIASDEAAYPFVLSGLTLLGVVATLLCILYRLKLPVLLSHPNDVRRYILSFYKPFLPILLVLVLLLIFWILMIDMLEGAFVPTSIDIDAIDAAMQATFFFLMCFAAGQNFIISLFFAVKYFPRTNIILRVIFACLVPPSFVGFLVGIDIIGDLNFWSLLLPCVTVFGILYGLSTRKRNTIATLLLWVAIFPISFLLALSFLLLDDGSKSAFALFVCVTIFQLLIVLGPVLLIRFFSRPLQDRILADASTPREI